LESKKSEAVNGRYAIAMQALMDFHLIHTAALAR
jgi:hypothetical protein